MGRQCVSELDVRLKLRCRVTRGALKAVHVVNYERVHSNFCKGVQSRDGSGLWSTINAIYADDAWKLHASSQLEAS